MKKQRPSSYGSSLGVGCDKGRYHALKRRDFECALGKYMGIKSRFDDGFPRRADIPIFLEFLQYRTRLVSWSRVAAFSNEMGNRMSSEPSLPSGAME
jgi:hypothetical protein